MKQQILVIDDSLKIHQLVEAILATEPVEITYSKEASLGLVLAASKQPDLILLDIDMPGIDGFEACRRLKADPITADCPVIFLTAHAATPEKVYGFDLGAIDYVTKPFVADELRARVRAALQTQTAIRTLADVALVDPMTGLGNEAMFEQRLSAEIGLRGRTNGPLSVIAIEVPALKTIAERFGPAVEAKVLQMIGQFMSEVCRTEDVPCCFGNTFAVLAPQTTLAEATAVAQEIEKKMNTICLKPKTDTPSLVDNTIRLTAETGVAEALNRYDRTILTRAQARFAA